MRELKCVKHLIDSELWDDVRQQVASHVQQHVWEQACIHVGSRVGFEVDNHIGNRVWHNQYWFILKDYIIWIPH
jgi:hypothetical protein